MKYQDIEIRIRANPQGGYEAEAHTVHYPRTSIAFHPPYHDEEVVSLLTCIDRFFVQSNLGDYQGSPPQIQKIGEDLFKSLFLEGSVAEVFKSMLTFSDRGGEGLRIWLNFDLDDALAPSCALPWELVYHPAPSRGFLSRQSETPILRYLDVPRPRATLEIGLPLRILAVAASPDDEAPLRIATEWQQICETLGSIAETKLLENPTVDQVRKELKRGGWQILHYMGHGGFRQEDAEGFLLFGRHGYSHIVTGTMLAENLKAARDLRLVFLSTCKGGRLRRERTQNPFLSMAPAILSAGIPAVVAMQFSISDPAARTFAEEFYAQLAEEKQVDVAAADARMTMYNDHDRSLEWFVPTVFLSTRDGRILTLSSRGTRQMTEKAPATETAPLRVGIRSFAGPDSFAKKMPSESDLLLSLDDLFNDRYISDASLWNTEVFRRLEAVLQFVAADPRPILLNLAAHASIAFAAGYCLEAKSGIEVTIRQRSQYGTQDWKQGKPEVISVSTGSSAEGPLWLDEPDRPGSPDTSDVALAVSIAQQVTDDVELYLERSGLAVRRIIPATIMPEPGSIAVRDGTHALQLAQSLNRKIRSRTAREREGTLHLFASAPNAVLFFLGQLSRGIGPVQLYEYDFGTGKPGAYTPSILLPPQSARP